MATTTPNYDWPIPEDTDLVKDGAKAIRDLGNAIDTSAEDFAGGLVHIKTENYTAVTGVNLFDIFSSEFDSYRIIYNHEKTAAVSFNLRLVSGTTAATSANYERQNLNFTTALSITTGTDTSSGLSAGAIGSEIGAIEISNPFQAVNTKINSISDELQNRKRIHGVLHTLTNSFDGLTFFVSAGLLNNGSISAYGYRKA